MAWLIFGLALAAVLALAGFAFWRRLVEPWRELEELVTAIAARKTPRKFLMTGNRNANALGLALEQFADRQGELERIASEGSVSLQTILGALPDGLAIVDERRRLRLVNAEFRRVFALSEGVEGAALLEILPDAVVERALVATIQKGEAHRESIRLVRGNAPAKDLEISMLPYAARGEHGGAVMLFRDITAMQQVETMRRDFVANVSHELRTPLSIFRGYLETLLDDPQQPTGELVRILEVMDRHAERLTLLVEDILSLAQLESPGARLEFTEIYLPEFLEGILRDWDRRFGAKLLQASLEAPADLPVILADEHRLQEVIYNLLDNAVKYSQSEGKIWLKATRDADHVRIAVADHGIGIPARDLPRVFERFYRADKARSRQIGGTGLGLSIVKHIVQLHGGSVQAESELGSGSTISISLPIVPASRELPDLAGVTES